MLIKILGIDVSIHFVDLPPKISQYDRSLFRDIKFIIVSAIPYSVEQ